MVEAKDILIAAGVVVALVVMFWFAYSVTPYPVATFTADGTHIGDFAFGSTYYNIFHFIFGSEVDGMWVTPNGMVQYLLLPFFAIALVMYGVMSEIPLGGNVPWFNTAMALIIALVVSSSGMTVRAMRGYLTIAGNMAIAFFGLILVLGIALQGFKTLGSMGVPIGAFRTVAQEANMRQYVVRMTNAAATVSPAHKKYATIQQLAAKASGELAKGQVQNAKNTADAISRELAK
jgi:hypothetical protein